MNIQVILVITLVLLTISLAAVCFYAITVLKDARYTIRKVNRLLDTSSSLDKILVHPAGVVLKVIQTIAETVHAIKDVTTKAEETKYDYLEKGKELVETTKELVQEVEKIGEPISQLIDIPKRKNFRGKTHR